MKRYPRSFPATSFKLGKKFVSPDCRTDESTYIFAFIWYEFVRIDGIIPCLLQIVFSDFEYGTLPALDWWLSEESVRRQLAMRRSQPE